VRFQASTTLAVVFTSLSRLFSIQTAKQLEPPDALEFGKGYAAHRSQESQ
jgi:hypothetical protein